MISQVIEEHEQAAIARTAFQIDLDDSKKAIEAFPHIDGFCMQIDGDRGSKSQHGLGHLLEDFRKRAYNAEWDSDREASWKLDLDEQRLLDRRLNAEEC